MRRILRNVPRMTIFYGTANVMAGVQNCLLSLDVVGFGSTVDVAIPTGLFSDYSVLVSCHIVKICFHASLGVVLRARLRSATEPISP